MPWRWMPGPARRCGCTGWTKARAARGGAGNNRGLAYWTDGAERIPADLSGCQLVALDARTGRPVTGFEEGRRGGSLGGLDRE